MAAILRDSATAAAVVMRRRPRAIPLAMIHGLRVSFLSCMSMGLRSAINIHRDICIEGPLYLLLYLLLFFSVCET